MAQQLRAGSLRNAVLGDQSCRQSWTDPRDIIEPIAGLVGPMPSHDQTVKLKKQGFEHLLLGSECGKTRTCHLGHSFVAPVGSDVEQFLHAMASDRRDNPELSKMSADRIDCRGKFSVLCGPRACPTN
jgi:hypothetical protein